MHGDAARIHYIQKLVVISWQSALVTGCSWDTRYVWTVIPNHLCPPETLQQVHRFFCYA
jgi:hypothetical protein